ncbi:hypothetical protein FH972_027351 [Carpinus fangiana]|uniref:Uncharacterized protein n=1 Tax=Carpinus fangiana TaxID=176857 RepID=A0A5N6QA67_9ROSI|nr:hypothetical protein FH972_027351 [Carpinus fangiana]
MQNNCSGCHLEQITLLSNFEIVYLRENGIAREVWEIPPLMGGKDPHRAKSGEILPVVEDFILAT